MGACSSDQVTSPAGSSPKLIRVSQELAILSNHLLKNFIIGKQILQMFNGISYTRSQAADLAKSFVNGVLMLQKKQQSQENLMMINSLFNQQNENLIKNEQIFYQGMLNKIKGIKLSQYSKSKIYHKIANLQKQTKFEERKKNQYGIEEVKLNDYKDMSDHEIQQISKYEQIADRTRDFGQKIGFKFQSIKKQSQKISSLLEKCMQKHIQAIGQLKYDLSDNQVMKMASISRQACNFYDNGVFVLLVYLVESCKRLQLQSKSPDQIERLLKRVIWNISKEYPPGSGLSSEHQELIKTLKELQNPKNYNKVEFNHQQIKLTAANKGKQEQIEQIITKYALIAQQLKESFEGLVKATCLSTCVYFKIGLKYYPKQPNVKALTRIKEKMFFKKESNQQKVVQERTIKQVLDKEQSEYRKKIDEILEKTDKVQFKISDMVRGKCVFLDVADIIGAVNEIKRFVAENPQFGIAQIESRFTNKLPISDVTLKIVLSNRIVAQLQLTIQTNAAAYSFAHKIYELQRTKVFSKLKIVHNYFQESKDEFNELTQSCLQLQTIKSSIPPQVITDISQYFKLEYKSQSFKTILQQKIHENIAQLKKLQTSINPLLQDLMIVAFNIALGKWEKEIGKIINKALKNEQLSPKIKSVILSIFFNKFHLPTQSQNMLQFFIKKIQPQRPYMQEFMKYYFQIDSAFKYIKQNQRIYHRAQQLSQIIIYRQYQSDPVQLKQIAFITNPVIQQDSSEKIKQIQEIFDFYFVTKNEKYTVYPLFPNYARWLQSQIKNIKDKAQAQKLHNQVQIVKSEYLIQNKYPKQAAKYLQNSLNYFKSRQNHQKVMKCQILSTQCRIKTSQCSISQYNDVYEKNVLEKAKILGLQLKGLLYADSLWRIQRFLSQNQNQENRKQILSTFTHRALQQMSRSRGAQFIYVIKNIWPEYEKYNLQKPQIKANDRIRYAKLKIGAEGCPYLIKAKWSNLIKLDLSGNSIGVDGCQQIITADWKNMTELNLRANLLGAAGCEYLSKADWKNMTILVLEDNNIGPEGCEHLTRADWKNLKKLHLGQNNIGVAGCEQLAKADWKNMHTLDLWDNNIGLAACEQLIKGDWKHLNTLSLWKNNVRDEGCEPLAKADWKNLSTLNLTSNNIGAVGCEHLAKADWKNLSSLNLQSNKIGPAGCVHLIKADWKNITQLNLGGCEEIIKADWENLTKLNLCFNDIGTAGCVHLSKSDWKNLANINLQSNGITTEGCEHLIKAEWKNIKLIMLRGSNKFKSFQVVRKMFAEKKIKIDL